jgi:flagellar biosynthesis GTPase FlhF
VNVELHTVGTKRFLGCASFQFEPSIDHDIRGKRAEEVKEMDNASPDAESQALKRREERKEVRRDLQKIYNHEAPASIERQEAIVHDMTRKLWRLERLIWKDRVDALRKEMQEKRMLEWKKQKELRKSAKAQAKADVEGIEKPSRKQREI